MTRRPLISPYLPPIITPRRIGVGILKRAGKSDPAIGKKDPRPHRGAGVPYHADLERGDRWRRAGLSGLPAVNGDCGRE
jgi:hypothetical protein